MEGAMKSLTDLEGVKALNEGRIRLWSEVEKELFGGDDNGDN